MTAKNLGPCNVLNCEAKDVRFRRFTKYGLKSAKNSGTYEDCDYLEINDQLCPIHYLSIVQSRRNKSNNQKRKSRGFEDDDNIIEIDDIIEDVDTNNTEFKLSELLENLINDNQINLDNWSNIDVDVQEDVVLLSRNDFDCLTNKIKEMQIKVNQYENNKEYLNQFRNKFELLSDLLYVRQRNLNLDVELDPENFKNMIEQHEPELKGFFDELTHIFLSSKKSRDNKDSIENAKKSLVGFCYLLVGLKNQQNNSLQLEIGLYLSASGATVECIDIMSRLGISVSYKTLDRHKKNISSNHKEKINKYFEENASKLFCFNIDDYHSIHSYRNPNTTTLSTACHMATCVSKTVNDSNAVPAYVDGIPVHNPKNIEADRIIKYLNDKYFSSLSISYNAVKHSWLRNNAATFEQFDRLELLSVHSYDYAIESCRDDRSMKNCHLVNIKELNLKNLDDYLNALKMITGIPSLNNYLQNNIIPVIADFPGQLFIRKAITLLHKHQNQQNNNFNQIPPIINNFVAILGPLHVSLNMRENIVIVHWDFFEIMYKSVFGINKVLAAKPKPWKINQLLELLRSAWIEVSSEIYKKFGGVCKDLEYQTMIDLLDNLIPAALDIYAVIFRSGSFEEYVDTIFRLWSFALRWKRKNYNKIPLAFLSDYFYWKDNNHPFLEAIQSQLVNFNDYYVENWHSKIRANTSPQYSAEAITLQSLVLDAQDQSFINTFKKLKKCPYKESTFNFLKYKTSLFLIDYFHKIYLNVGRSKKISNKKYYLATLNMEVKLMCIPTGYHTCKPPVFNECDYCYSNFENNNDQSAIMLICGHAFHKHCYEMKKNQCTYCLEFYKEGVISNVSSYIKRLEKENLTDLLDEVEESRVTDGDEEAEEDITEEQIIALDFKNAFDLIKDW